MLVVLHLLTASMAKFEAIGGHSEGMRFQGDRILKRLQSDGRGDKEILFYERIKQHSFLSSWTPEYYGEARPQ